MADAIADLDENLGDFASAGGGYLHRRLVTLERDQRIVDFDGITRLHVHLDDRDILEVTNVGHCYIDLGHVGSFEIGQR